MESHGTTNFSSLYILICLHVFGFNLGSCYGARVAPREPASTVFVRNSCSTTNYPALCFSSLSAYASTIQSSPVQLASTALLVSLAGARSTSTMMTRMEAAGGLSSREEAAMKDCMETIGVSMDELRESIGEMGHLGGRNMGFQINNIQTWVSAALTDDDTCMEGFGSRAMNGEVKNAIRDHVTNVAQLTSNALAFINALASTP